MRKFLILGILILGFILRTIYLDVSPPGFNADEASLGYNAYSILKTGKDEWGESFPLVFKSFSDYKPGLYVYLTIPAVAILGLNEFATRFPSIILGSLSILIIYLISKQIFKKELIAISTAFLLAVSPWHLHFSRGAWETNIATFFLSLGVLGFLKGLEGNRWYFLSAISFVAAMYSYQSPRVVVPLLLLLIILGFWRKINFKKVIAPAILGVILIIPLILIIFSNRGLARFQGVSIFTDIGPTVRVDQDRGEHENINDISSKIYHNKLTAYGLNFASHFLDHFTPNFLFISGDPLGRNKVPEMGQLYFFEIVTLILGLYVLIKTKFNSKRLIFFWLIVAPVAASLTYQTPHALRAHNMVIPLTLISGVGLGFLLEKITMSRYKYLLLSLVMMLGLFFISKYFHQYYVHLPKQYALEWEYGFSKLVPFIFEKKQNFEKVIITDRYDQAYILMLFYSQYDPIKYQQTAKPTGLDKYGFSTITSFDNFEFRPIGNEEPGRSKNILFVGTDLELSNDHSFLEKIYFPNKTPVFKIIGT